MSDDQPLHRDGGSRPVPDPTLLTSQQLFREVAALKELFLTHIDRIDKATDVATENYVRVPTEVDKQVGHLKELMMQMFAGVDTQFRERDERVAQTARDTKLAVDAALAAAKESAEKQAANFTQSISKSDATTEKQIDSLGALFRTATAAQDAQIAEVKDRLTRIESMGIGRTAGTVEQRAVTSETRSGAADLRGVIALVISGGLFFILLVTMIAGYAATQ